MAPTTSRVDPDQLLTAVEAAALCSLSVYTFNERARHGEIRRVYLGGRKGIRYRRADVLDYIERNTGNGAGYDQARYS